ncbi:MAG TPA: PIN domain-containing protein [Planktothrix sp. UBA8407]|nr:PIN domain-containing protein [Planktothrix sp. UBA8407]HBK21141.1 PIN domain-containing protein [Planktothrix sp. UBA10369]
MNIYVETNFVLELVFEQEQFKSCEEILLLSEQKPATLIIPAYSLAEPHEKLIRQARNRKALQQSLDREFKQLERTVSYKNRIQNNIREFFNLLVEIDVEETKRFAKYRNRLLSHADIISLNGNILFEAATYENRYALMPQDALVYASILFHLQQNQPTIACFLNRNSRDFDTPEIKAELNSFNCRMISQFDQGLSFIQSQLLP